MTKEYEIPPECPNKDVIESNIITYGKVTAQFNNCAECPRLSCKGFRAKTDFLSGKVVESPKK